MPGIIMGALGGMGEQAANIGATMFKTELDRETRTQDRQQESDLTLQRAKTLEEFKATLANRERTAQTERIDAAAGRLAEVEVGKKRGIIASNIADPTAWTPEQQAAVDQSLALDKQSAVADPKLRTQAAIQTGDIDPKTAATLTQKDDAALYKAMWEQSKEDGRNQRADARIAAQQESSDKRLAYLFAALEKRGDRKAGADTAKEALQFLEGSRKEIQSEAQNTRALYQAQLKDASRSERAKIEADFAPKFAEIERKRNEIEEDYGHVRERVGLPARTPKPAAPNPAPAPSPAPGSPKPAAGQPLPSLPAGARKIGTSGGKPVYETPDGKRFIGQ